MGGREGGADAFEGFFFPSLFFSPLFFFPGTALPLSALLSGPSQIRSFFFTLPPQISFFLLSLEVFSWSCGRGSRPWPHPK